jgi:hypothetical protein
MLGRGREVKRQLERPEKRCANSIWMELTPWSRVLLEELAVVHLLKK